MHKGKGITSKTYLYSIYRASDDKLIALDVMPQEAIKILGYTNPQTLYRFFWRHGGDGKYYTITRKTIAEVEEEMND